MGMFGKTLWLACAGLWMGLGVWCVPAVAQESHDGGLAGAAQARRPFAFEVFSIRPHKPGTPSFDRQYTPDGFRVSLRLHDVILLAYSPRPGSPVTFLHAPDWLLDDWYDIDARVAPGDMATWQVAGPDIYKSALLLSALRAALEERCKLTLHITSVELPYWNIVVGKHGATLKETVPGAIKPVVDKTSAAGKGFYIEDAGKRQFVGVSMPDLAIVLMRLTHDYPVQDKTGPYGAVRFCFALV
jgi:uncharacterized protein (TIGR03435 family)